MPGWIEEGVLSAMAEHGHQRLAGRAVPAGPGRGRGEAVEVTTCVLQGGIGDIGGASVVPPYIDLAQRLGDQAREDATLEPD